MLKNVLGKELRKIQKHSLSKSSHSSGRQQSVSDGDATSTRRDAFTCGAQYLAREALKMDGTTAASLGDSIASFHGSW